jgi:hypothetical protein
MKNEQYLANSTKELLNKYKEVKPFEVINDVEICAIDKGDLEFFIGYTQESLDIETQLKEENRELKELIQSIIQLSHSDKSDDAHKKALTRIENLIIDSLANDESKKQQNGMNKAKLMKDMTEMLKTEPDKVIRGTNFYLFSSTEVEDMIEVLER